MLDATHRSVLIGGRRLDRIVAAGVRGDSDADRRRLGKHRARMRGERELHPSEREQHDERDRPPAAPRVEPSSR